MLSFLHFEPAGGPPAVNPDIRRFYKANPFKVNGGNYRMFSANRNRFSKKTHFPLFGLFFDSCLRLIVSLVYPVLFEL